MYYVAVANTMLKQSYFLLLILFAGNLPSLAQENIDSLKQLLAAERDGPRRVDVLNELAFELYDSDLNAGYKYAVEAYASSKALNYVSGQKRALIIMGLRYAIIGEFRNALKNYKKAYNLDPEEDEITAYAFIVTGNVFRSLAKFDSARFFYNKSIDILKFETQSSSLAFAYKSLAHLMVIQWQNAEAGTYFRKAQKIYAQLQDIGGQAEIWFALAEVSKNMTYYDSAYAFQSKGCVLAQQSGQQYVRVQCYMSQGDYYSHLGEYVKALDMLLRAVDLLKNNEQPESEAETYHQIGEVYGELGQHDLSLKYDFDALKILERFDAKYEMAKLYSQIGWTYKNQLNFPEAKRYMNKSLAIRQEIKDEHGISNSFNVLGVLYYQEKKYDQSLAILEKSLEIRKRIGHIEGVSACIFNMAAVYEDLGRYDKALDLQFEALQIDERIGSKQGLSISYNQIGQLYTKAHNFAEALRYLTKARNLAKETGSKMLMMTNHLYFSAFYEEQGELRKALDYHQSYVALNDSIYSEENALKLAEMQALYQVEQKNREIELLNQSKEIQRNQIQIQRSQIGQQRTIIFGGLIGLILICFFAVIIFRHTARMGRANREIVEQKEEIEAQSEKLIGANQTIASINKDLETKIETRTADLRQAYKELDTFFYRSSHDFRRPLTTFLGLAEVANITVKDKNALELFAKVKETASNLDKMLVKLQSISDVGAHQLVYKQVLLKEIFDSVIHGFQQEISANTIKVVSNIELKEPFNSYPAMVKIIVENLLENAVSFARFSDAVIEVRAIEGNGEVILEVKDNGQGIDPQLQDRIFEMYFRGNERSKGNGLGLYIVQKAVNKLEGRITFQSEKGRGSVFTVTLPANQNHSEGAE
ncbi:MAG: tetratricopeptide repeat-containing sensor histidine kinase [Chryseolinea sp.]